jgi:hypothetical protein
MRMQAVVGRPLSSAVTVPGWTATAAATVVADDAK